MILTWNISSSLAFLLASLLNLTTLNAMLRLLLRDHPERHDAEWEEPHQANILKSETKSGKTTMRLLMLSEANSVVTSSTNFTACIL